MSHHEAQWQRYQQGRNVFIVPCRKKLELLCNLECYSERMDLTEASVLHGAHWLSPGSGIEVDGFTTAWDSSSWGFSGPLGHVCSTHTCSNKWARGELFSQETMEMISGFLAGLRSFSWHTIDTYLKLCHLKTLIYILYNIYLCVLGMLH